jgi:hypothetical protein
MNRRSCLTLLLIYLAFGISDAADSSQVDENALFADTTTLVQAKTLSDTQKVKDPSERTGTSMGGDVTVAPIVSTNREFLSHAHLSNTALTNLLVGSFELDSRLQNGTKVFGNLEADYIPSLDSAQRYSLFLRELFMDVNVNHSVYFRLGKQVLQWGRCFFWNPTDLINVEQKPFIDKIGSREGTFGAKMHAPFGTKYNVYAFLDLHSATRADSVALSVKGEYLVGGTEMALSAWGRRGKPVVLGYDISTNVAGFDLTGEASASDGWVMPRMVAQDSTLILESIQNRIVPRVSAGISKSLDFMGFHDALTVQAEGFYNNAGYRDNVFADTAHYLVPWYVPPPAQDGQPAPPIRVTKTQFLLASGLYDANYHSPYYAALFIGISRFVLSDLTCSVNGIMNIKQQCGIVTGSVGYTTLGNLTIGATVIGYVGAKNTEYTFLGQSAALRLTADVRF